MQHSMCWTFLPLLLLQYTLPGSLSKCIGFVSCATVSDHCIHQSIAWQSGTNVCFSANCAADIFFMSFAFLMATDTLFLLMMALDVYILEQEEKCSVHLQGQHVLTINNGLWFALLSTRYQRSQDLHIVLTSSVGHDVITGLCIPRDKHLLFFSVCSRGSLVIAFCTRQLLNVYFLELVFAAYELIKKQEIKEVFAKRPSRQALL